MRFSGTLTASILALTLVSGLFLPHPSRPLNRLERRLDNNQDGYQVSSESHTHTDLQEPSAFVPRQNKGKKPASCECKTKCHSKHFYIDPKKCTRCLRCPPGLVSDPKSRHRACAPDSGQNEGEDKKKKRREDKERKWPEKKKRMTEKFKDKSPDRKKRTDKRKVKRMAMCAPIAPLGLEILFYALEMADGYFSEDYLESDEVLKLWPADLEVRELELDEWTDDDEEKFYTSQSFLDGWLSFANDNWEETNKNHEEQGLLDRRAEGSSGLDSEENSEENGEEYDEELGHVGSGYFGVPSRLDKRRFGAGGVGAMISGIVQAAIRGWARTFATEVKAAIARIVQVAPKGKGQPHSVQAKRVQYMIDEGPMRWCLNRRTPRNHA